MVFLLDSVHVENGDVVLDFRYIKFTCGCESGTPENERDPRQEYHLPSRQQEQEGGDKPATPHALVHASTTIASAHLAFSSTYASPNVSTKI